MVPSDIPLVIKPRTRSGMAGRHSRKKDILGGIRSMSTKTMVSLLGAVTVIGGGATVFTMTSMRSFGDEGSQVSRITDTGPASRSMTRENLFAESVSTDVTGSWSLGESADEIRKNLDAQADSNDDASQAKQSLQKSLDEAGKLDMDGMTTDSVSALKKAMSGASKLLKKTLLQDASDYNASRVALDNAVKGLVRAVVPVEKPQETASGGSGGTSAGNSPAAPSLGVTVPANEMQQWFHDYLLSNGYTEADFTAGSYIINRESSWNPRATNPSSGAYGLAQALPGSKMASHGADWQSNYQTQLKWFIDYCNGRYGSINGAYNFWVQNHWY